MTSKQRAQLRSIATGIEPIFQIGKGGVSDAMIEGLDAALTKRELIKITVLRNSESNAKQLIGILAERLGAEPIAAIGSKIVLYRRSDSDNVKHIEF